MLPSVIVQCQCQDTSNTMLPSESLLTLTRRNRFTECLSGRTLLNHQKPTLREKYIESVLQKSLQLELAVEIGSFGKFLSSAKKNTYKRLIKKNQNYIGILVRPGMTGLLIKHVIF